jgi:Chromo (CHRromatin Organisation MOdifier) domain
LEPPLDIIDDTSKWEVEMILKHCIFSQWKKKQYLIRWRGYLPAHNSWINTKDLHAKDLVSEFKAHSQQLISGSTIELTIATHSSPIIKTSTLQPAHHFHSEDSPEPSSPFSLKLYTVTPNCWT